ncbi:MAG: M67 family metallopeptidase [Fimbriimonadales bacterium]|nr:MAG: Mov34/MPN/PAD-1 family protein [Fimbriimonadales bacterium]
MTLRLPPDVAASIRAHARDEYPHECCGALLGTEAGDTRIIQQVIRLANERADQRERRFYVSPQQVLMAERQARAAGLLLLGFYHSHPDHPAIPSEYDREHALPYYSYPIVSVVGGEPVEVRSWRLLEDRSGFTEERVSD